LAPYIGEAAFVLSVYIILKLVEEKRSRDIGLIPIQYGLKDLGIGLLYGAVSMIVIFAALALTGRISLGNPLWHPAFSHYLLTGLLLFIAVGIAEEFFFRGYLIDVFSRPGKPGLGVIISSVLFAFAHAFNPNVAVLGLINIFIVGLLLAYMYVKTGNLWMPIGFHIAWNYFQGNVFGFPVSGTSPHGLYNIDDFNGTLWSGGSFGPEAGLAATVVLLVLFFAVWKLPGDRRNRQRSAM
jgi:membrane protease YdiL (CAAX protease family)